MLCPDCSHDNIEGVDYCEACGQPLVGFEPSGCALEQSISRHGIGVLNRKRPVSVPPTATVREAVAVMVENRIGCLLITEEGALQGVFTERDILNRISPNLDMLDRPVAEFMTAQPVAVKPGDSIAYALQAMHSGGYRHVPLVDDNDTPLGIISVRDILRFLCIRYAELRTA